jgi:hypothetical protein
VRLKAVLKECMPRIAWPCVHGVCADEPARSTQAPRKLTAHHHKLFAADVQLAVDAQQLPAAALLPLKFGCFDSTYRFGIFCAQVHRCGCRRRGAGRPCSSPSGSAARDGARHHHALEQRGAVLPRIPSIRVCIHTRPRRSPALGATGAGNGQGGAGLCCLIFLATLIPCALASSPVADVSSAQKTPPHHPDQVRVLFSCCRYHLPLKRRWARSSRSRKSQRRSRAAAPSSTPTPRSPSARRESTHANAHARAAAACLRGVKLACARPAALQFPTRAAGQPDPPWTLTAEAAAAMQIPISMGAGHTSP